MNSTHLVPKSKFDDLPDWLTPQEVRSFLRLGKSTLYEKLRSGEISSRKFGKQYRISKATLRPPDNGLG
jgi:excisionase family DNA binding protein